MFSKEVVNKVIDPSFESDWTIANGFGLYHSAPVATNVTGAAASLISTEGANRTHCAECTGIFTSSISALGVRTNSNAYCRGGKNLAVGVSMRVLSAPGPLSVRVRVFFLKADKTSFATPSIVTAATVPANGTSWTRAEGVVPIPADAAYFNVDAQIINTTAATGAVVVRCDSFMGAIHDTVVPYFDGYSQGASWDGVHDQSTAWRRDYDLAVPIGDEIYEMFAPYVDTFGDPGNNLRDMCRGFGTMLQPIDDIVRDGDNGEPGYSQALDLTRAKEEWLPWLGQFVGYRVTERRPEQDRDLWADIERGRVVTRSAHRRGTIARMVEEVQSYLNDPKTVFIQTRVGTPHRMTIFYYTAQIQSPATAATIAAVAQAQKAKGLILTVTPLSGGDWSTLIANQATWNVVTTKFASWNEVISNPAKP